MAKKDYASWDRNDLIKEIEELRRRKKYGLVWENKPEDVVEQCKRELPILEEFKEREIITDPDSPVNLLIEGDNYHVLSVLNYTHQGKIDAIYIDPPYNTGARDWKYNNDYVDGEDPYRHTKWISFMHHRLNIAKNLLSPNGIICVTIDDYELPRLVMLMDDVFGEQHRLGTAVIRNNPQGRSTVKGFSINHEYALFYAKSNNSQPGRLPRSEKQLERYPETDEKGEKYLWENFRKTGSDSLRSDRPKQFYPIYVHGNKMRLPKMGWDDHKKAWNVMENPSKDEVVVLPIDDLKNERVWKWGFERVIAKPDHLKVRKSRNGKIEIYRRNYPSEGSLPNTFWDKPKYAAGSHGTNLLTKIFKKSHVFEFPKSLYAVQDCIRVCTDKKNALVLDFFAGSGTTGHAILELNEEDGGNRRFILCTNNEINGQEAALREKGLSEREIQEHGICRAVTYPRIKNVIKGYSNTRGLPGNLKYFKTSFVPADPTDKNKVELTQKATEMLCVKEDTFEEVESKTKFKIFRNKKHYTGIIFDHQAIDEFKKAIKNIDGRFNVYVFSLGDDTFDEEFEDIKTKVKLSPIPEAILRVYRRIFK